MTVRGLIALLLVVGVAFVLLVLPGCDRRAAPPGDEGKTTGAPVASSPPAEPASVPAADLLLYSNPGLPADLFDDLENSNHWALESADDHAWLMTTDERASQGMRSLAITYEAFGRGKFQIRRDGRFDFSGSRALSLDVFVEEGPLEMAMGLVLGPDETFYGSRTAMLETGWNRDVSFPLSAKGFGRAPRSWYGRVFEERLADVRRVSFTFLENDRPQGRVFVDNIRLTPPPRTMQASRQPSIRIIRASRRHVPLYGLIEWTVMPDGAYQDFFDRGDVDLLATLISPSGATREIHGFLYDFGDESRPPEWRLRFTPDRVGRWLLAVSVETGRGDFTSPSFEFTVSGSTVAAGFVRVSRRDAGYFEYTNGDFFYPIGMNVAWAANMDHYFRRLSQAGGNLVRVWMCPWHLQLESKTAVGAYDLLVARELDTLFDLAESYGLHIQLVLQYHGILTDSWDDNPYNSANGGPCREPEDFFTDPEARRLFRRFLDYLTARYAHSPALFAWELWNEVNFARFRSMADVVDWHREMTEHLRKADPYGHPITTSLGQHEWNAALFGLPHLDFMSAHLYTPNLGDEISTAHAIYRQYAVKPYFLGEFGLSQGPPAGGDDPEGLRMAAGLWLSFCTPASGAGLPWWWDLQIDRKDLYSHFASLAAFASGHDRRGKHFRPIHVQLQPAPERTLDLRGILGPSAGYFYVFDPALFATASAAPRPVLSTRTHFDVTGLLGGDFNIEVWDTHAGKALHRSAVRSAHGTLRVSLPPCRHPLAVKLEHVGTARPAVIP